MMVELMVELMEVMVELMEVMVELMEMVELMTLQVKPRICEEGIHKAGILTLATHLPVTHSLPTHSLPTHSPPAPTHHSLGSQSGLHQVSNSNGSHKRRLAKEEQIEILKQDHLPFLWGGVSEGVFPNNETHTWRIQTLHTTNIWLRIYSSERMIIGVLSQRY